MIWRTYERSLAPSVHFRYGDFRCHPLHGWFGCTGRNKARVSHNILASETGRTAPRQEGFLSIRVLNKRWLLQPEQRCALCGSQGRQLSQRVRNQRWLLPRRSRCPASRSKGRIVSVGIFDEWGLLSEKRPLDSMKEEQILFLDFDGVLHPAFAEPGQLLMHMPAFAHAVSGSNCEIVISSSWRFQHSFEALRQMFPAELRDRVLHCTGEALICRHARHQEILAHLALCGYPVDWRALDDSGFEFPHDCRRLILCNAATGLGNRQLDAIQDWLRTS